MLLFEGNNQCLHLKSESYHNKGRRHTNISVQLFKYLYGKDIDRGGTLNKKGGTWDLVMKLSLSGVLAQGQSKRDPTLSVKQRSEITRQVDLRQRVSIFWPWANSGAQRIIYHDYNKTLYNAILCETHRWSRQTAFTPVSEKQWGSLCCVINGLEDIFSQLKATREQGKEIKWIEIS